MENHRFDWRVTVPANTTATIYVPAEDVSHVTESGQPLENVNGVTFLRMEKGSPFFTSPRASYDFSSRQE